MANTGNMDFIVQCIDKEIVSDQVHELKDNLDPDYKFVVGIALSDVNCSPASILEQLKVKGIEILPENFEAVHIMSSKAVQPNKRFYAWFKPIQVAGDELVVKFRDPDWSKVYKLQFQLLLTNNPNGLTSALFE
ncbi:MAG: hypothetical protein C0594_04700 [Marinilabiliales bacterium]|nr:MAG: hypothetical protein C0594_04700 [Marinilabiliales bacterium]